MRTFPSVCLPIGAVLCVFLSGCAVTELGPPSTELGLPIAGSVHGGQSPIVGARVYLYAANSGVFTPNSSGYGNASTSLLTSGTQDSSGNYYVLSVAGGAFTVTGDYTCTAGQQVYLYAVGGSQGSVANPVAALMAAVGTCPGLIGTTNNTFSPAQFILVNEVSTVAAAYAFAGFATDATHVSSSGRALAQTGIANAFANATNMESLSTGVALATTPAGNGVVPQTTINTLANILASCVNSNGSITGPTNPTACYTLFNDAQSGGSSGTIPSDTATAAINIAHNPTANVAALYALGTASPPFMPTLTAQPGDFTIGLKFTGGGLSESVSSGTPQICFNCIAIDASGDAWVVNDSSAQDVTEFSPLGAAMSGANGFTGAGLNYPESIAIDQTGNIWIGNQGGNLSEFSSQGVAAANAPYTGGGMDDSLGLAVDGSSNIWSTLGGSPYGLAEFSDSGTAITGSAGYQSGYNGQGGYGIGLAIDGSGSAWYPVPNSSKLDKISSSGALLSPGYGFTGGGLNYPIGVAIDSGGNAWVSSQGSTIAKFSNSGTPLASSGYSGNGTFYPYGIAVDGAGNVLTANYKSNAVVKLSNSGTFLSGNGGTGGFKAGGLLSSPAALALDGSGNAWVVNDVAAPYVLELIGVATPVITPISAGLPATPTGDGTSNLGTRP